MQRIVLLLFFLVACFVAAVQAQVPRSQARSMTSMDSENTLTRIAPQAVPFVTTQDQDIEYFSNPGSQSGGLRMIPGNRTVRGILQHVVGPGGETTGLAVLLDAPITIDGVPLNQLEIEREGVNIDKLLDKYLQASGPITYHTGVVRKKWPVMKASELMEMRPDGKADLELVQKKVSLSIEPAEIVWTNIAGRSSGIEPKVTLSVKNTSKTDLVFSFKTSAQLCLSITDAKTRKEIWHYPEASSDIATKWTAKTDETFSRSTTLPEEGAPEPGTYILKGTFCGYEDYLLTARFVVGAS